MSIAARNSWLGAGYGLALAIHFCLIVLVPGATVARLFLTGGADSARGGLSLLAALIPALLSVVVPLIALVSWGILRRRGIEPSPGHKSLAILATLPYLALIFWGLAT